ncbi:MAG: aminopeptidase P family protein [Deltaproteobacteria bacterium]|nr:aminopeptidase P family protein [Deltaproteobacteria bacterium]MBI2530906.1 aminopeptidase P family protein [Deltaproteobacteria bacterium]
MFPSRSAQSKAKTIFPAGNDPRRLRSDQALLLVSASEGDANMLYAAGFFVPDPFIFFQHKRKKYVVMSDLEIDRAKKQASADRVLSLSLYQRKLRKMGRPTAMIDILDLLFRERSIRRLVVPANFSALYADQLRAKGYSVQIKRDPFFAERETKSGAEVKHIAESLRVARLGLEAGIRALKRTKIKRDGYLYLDGARLTSETLKTAVNTTIMAQGWLPSHTIISSGNQCVDPHHEGSGPIKAHTSIIFDIFPRSQKNGYFGDLSRTVVRGRASDKLKDIYAAVQAGQQIGFDMIRDGANGKEVHQKILDLFSARGFPTGRLNGRMQGFFHGTGHGLGLDIHEPPRIAPVEATLKTGHVVTVEPGLYYLGVGGVRLEDVVVVTARGNRNLTDCPQFLEI